MSRHQLIHVTAAMDDRIKPEIVIASFSPVGGRSALGFPLALAFACGWTMASPAACSAWTWPACAGTPSPAGPQQHAGSVHVGGSSVACHRKGQVRKEKKRAPRRASFPESNRQQRLAIFRGPCMPVPNSLHATAATDQEFYGVWISAKLFFHFSEHESTDLLNLNYTGYVASALHCSCGNSNISIGMCVPRKVRAGSRMRWSPWGSWTRGFRSLVPCHAAPV